MSSDELDFGHLLAKLGCNFTTACAIVEIVVDSKHFAADSHRYFRF
jgi:hypothetical protein